MDFTEEEIQKILMKYKKSIQYNRDKYHKERKFNPEFMEKNRERAKDHYNRNKEQKKDYYEKHREELNMKQRYRYYKKRDRVEKFQEKFPEEFKILNESGFI